MKAIAKIVLTVSFDDLNEETMETLKAKIENEIGGYLNYFKSRNSEGHFFPSGSYADVKDLDCEISLDEVKK